MLKSFANKDASKPTIGTELIDGIENICEKISVGERNIILSSKKGASEAELKLVRSVNYLIGQISNKDQSPKVNHTIKPDTVDHYLEVVTAICRGDFEARIMNIPEQQSIERELSVRLNEMIDRTDAYVRESTACLDFISKNQYHRRIAEQGMVGSFGEASRKINTAADSVEVKITRFHEQVDEMNTISANLNESATSMSATVSSANEQVVNVASSAEEASVNTQTVSAAAEELSVTVGEINQQMINAAEKATNAYQEAQGANDLVHKLSKSSEEIGAVVNLINEVAEQTNLLSLNATIEAARAGEAGKGFAVVASEVKALAGQTRSATENIKKQINEIQAASEKAVHAIKQITSSIGEINEVSSSVSAAVEQQGNATKEIARNVQDAASGVNDISANINGVTRNVDDVSKSAESVKNISTQLAEQSKELRRILKN